MTPNEIRAELIRRGITLTKIAAEANCNVQQMSMCISGARIYPHLRRLIARRIGKPVGRVFDRHHPKASPRSRFRTNDPNKEAA